MLEEKRLFGNKKWQVGEVSRVINVRGIVGE